MRAYAPLLILAAILAAFLALDAAAPLLRPFGTVLGLDGSAGIIDHPDLWSGMDPLSKAAYWLGDFFCHQDEARTLILNGNEMPICIRDVALMASVAAGLVIAARFWDLASGMDRRMVVVCAVLVLLTPMEWAIEGAVDLDSPALRVIVSVPTGIGGAFLVARLLGMELRPAEGM
jgi:uncharacterized membrane protein